MFKWIKRLFSPQYRRSVLIASVFLVIGLVLSGTYASAVDFTNRLEFCAFTCHEMSFPYNEYKTSVHYQNQYGIRAACPDCHVPHKNWTSTMVVKAKATLELFDHFFGHIAYAPNTQQAFDADRLRMAEYVWSEMKSTDSRECRNCHSFEAMILAKQSLRAQGEHGFAMKEGKTCIDCHKGLVHKPVQQLLPQPPAAPPNFDIGN